MMDTLLKAILRLIILMEMEDSLSQYLPIILDLLLKATELERAIISAIQPINMMAILWMLFQMEWELR
jgi:hypothetical protein